MSEATRAHKTTQDHTPFYIFHMSDFPWSTGTHGLDQGVAGGERGNDSDIPTVFSKLRRVFDVVLVPSVLLGADVLCLARVASLRGVPRTMVRLHGFDAHGTASYVHRARAEKQVHLLPSLLELRHRLV